MAFKVYALTCGHLEGEFGRLMEGGEGRIRLPIPAYLIEHPKGTALFDTGMHPDCQHDPASRVGARIAGLFAFDYRPGEEIAARLTELGRDPARIDLIINSHFHFDHCGGNAQIPNATMIVQRRDGMPGWTPTRRRAADSTRAISISATNCASLTASTMCSATAGSCASRPTATRRATNP
jgi:N-acyl homoserine lactone hydrolase